MRHISGGAMPSKVNLDALITREDFEVTSDPQPSLNIQTLQVRDLEQRSFFYAGLRKPDFQRETAEWTPNRICELVTSFIDGDLIPAIILWRSGAYTFVIDGAHRLSALIAWVQDDYGDGPCSKALFGDSLPDEQVRTAKATRELINDKIGSYAQYQSAAHTSDNVSSNLAQRARRLGALAVQLQWVAGNAEKAEASFFRINQSAAQINKTELRILKARRQPHAIAARAIIRAGSGHKYWSAFSPDRRGEIEKLASDVYKTLFLPELKTPVKTLELPVAGKGYSSETLSLVVDFVGLAQGGAVQGDVADDADGAATIACLKRCQDVARRISGTDARSLSLHPAVYFYSKSGRYQPSAFLAIVSLILEFEHEGSAGFKRFANVRRPFENVLVTHKHLINQFVRKHGAGLRSHGRIADFYKAIFSVIDEKLTAPRAIVEKVRSSDGRFAFLEIDDGGGDEEPGPNFSASSKSAVFLRHALESPLYCGICSGHIMGTTAAIDHIQRKADGGVGVPENGQLAHPFCNSVVKN
jgi:hypothetical protein